MNKKQSNKYNSYVNLMGVLQANRPLYEAIAVMVTAVEDFMSLFGNLKRLNTDSVVDTTAVTDAKTNAKEKMSKLTAELASAALAWANEQGNPSLTSLFDYSYSDIRFSRDQEALAICTSVLQGLQENAEALSSFMVSSEDVSTLNGYITAFSDLSQTKGAVKGQSVSETRQMAELFTRIDTLLKDKIDRLMKRMESQQPAFYTAYLNARNIVDL